MMSRKKKILIIVHLILAFTFLLWLLMKPFVMEVVSQKSQLALYEMVIEHDNLFQNLSAAEQSSIIKGFESVGKHANPSFMHQFVETPAFALAWIFFSIVISLLLLFHIEGAMLVTWILPLLVIGYGYYLYASPNNKPDGLFPRESYVKEHYVEAQEGLSQRERLLKGWHLYLINEWAKERPNQDPALFEQQLNQGLFAFNIARLQWIQDGKGDEVVLAGFTSPPSLFRVLTYLIWNLLFAWLINRREKGSRSEPLSNPS